MEERLTALLNIYLAGELSDEQRRELLHLLGDERAGEVMMSLFPEGLEIEGELAKTEERIVDGVLRRITPMGERRRIGFWRRWGWVAAAVFLGLGVGTYLLIQRGPMSAVPEARGVVSAVVPGGARAVLMLADGRKVELDTTGKGLIARQGDAEIVRSGSGGIDYRLAAGTDAGKGGSMMNTLRTPRGGQYRLALPDGTRVWLNAASAITYPTVFTEKERRVQVSGEVYFEVSDDARRPFVVEVDGGSSVDVLGTSFNVSSYADDGPVRTTLVEGKVRVVGAGHGAGLVLRPGQQAQVSPEQVKLVARVDIDKVVAWKNGFFNFQDAHLTEVMRQVARWYDVEVVYEKGVPDLEFEGEISRNIQLADLLKALARAEVKFRIDGRRLVVLR